MQSIRSLLLAVIALSGWFASCALGSVTFTNLYQCRQNVNYAIGWYPNGLCKASDGNLYGTTEAGGTDGPGGTIYKLSSDGTLTFLAGFNGANSPIGPYASLIQGADGKLYGTTQSGGDNSSGAVFQVTTNGLLNTLVSLGGYSNGCSCYPDGQSPTAPLVQGNDGNFYGTTETGGIGASHDYGVVFCVATNGTFTNLVSFNGANGATPWFSGLTLGADGNFYGTTRFGGYTYNFAAGQLGDGTIFQWSTNGTLTTLASFYGANGQEPMSGLVQGTDGNFYGTTRIGGQYGYGTVFQLQVSVSGFNLNTLHSFTVPNPSGDTSTNVDGTQPTGGLVVGADGNLYGTTSGSGPNGSGTIFQIQTNGVLTTLYSFTGGSDGATPGSALVQGDDSNFYGATYTGGTYGAGTIFRLSMAASAPFIQTVTQADGILTLTWSAVSGQMYQVQYNTSLSPGNWSNLGNSVMASNTTATAIASITNSQCFYRIMLSQ